MVPALGLICLAWALSCLTLSHSAIVFEPTKCCVCDTLKPSDVPTNVQPQVMPSPFRIIVSGESYRPNTEVRVNLTATGGHYFRSFILAAYSYDKHKFRIGQKPIGQFKLLPDQDYQTKTDCISTDGAPGTPVTAYAIVSDDNKLKSNLRFVWNPNRGYGDVEFRATFIENHDTFWVAEKSRPLSDLTSGSPSLAVRKVTRPIDTSTCGDDKGCFREPPGCSEFECRYILTWSGDNQAINFELGGLVDTASDRYVALGISDDKYMGDDTVFTCAHNSLKERTEVFFSYNTKDPKKNNPIPKYITSSSSNYVASDKQVYDGLIEEEGSFENGRLRCRFRVKRDLDLTEPQLRSLRGGPAHLLFAHGFAVRGSPKMHGMSVEELPFASAEPVDFSRISNYHGRARYPLAKAHGCLMILAWVFFASLGLLLTKYYKPMWPNSRIFEHRYWFFGHFNCMATMFIVTIIAIILIFVEAGGYSEAPDLPQKAHPILGIIILVCIIINPILALIRPSEENKCRPVFNWFHWAFGTIANVLAIPTIFIGMDFGKVMVPWWATWILVIWVIFHIAVELSLEIHQCCTYKKNKERRKKWELTKREYPKQHHPEPEPAGRRFKRFMLFLHIGFTALITLIMIIIIAVS